MKRFVFLLFAIAALSIIAASSDPRAGRADDEAVPIFGLKIPAGYRDWRLISVAHEAGNLNDLRAILGNDVAIKAYREGKLLFPEGTIILRLAWNYVPSEENNQVFGRPQSFLAEPATADEFSGFVDRQADVLGEGVHNNEEARTPPKSRWCDRRGPGKALRVARAYAPPRASRG